MLIIFEWDAAEVGDVIEPTACTPMDFSPSAFTQTIAEGQIVGWFLVEELFFEDFGLPEYEGEDFQLDTVEIRAVDSIAGTVAIRAVLNVELDRSIPVETEAQLNDLYNAVTGAVQLFFWTGEGEYCHPEQAVGMFMMSGEISFVQINERVLHERRPAT